MARPRRENAGDGPAGLGWLTRRYEVFLALRYLWARRKQAFTSVVTGVSILGVAVGVSALIIALALLTGFQEDIQQKIIGANAHVFVFASGPGPMEEYRKVMEGIAGVDGVEGVSPTVEQSGMITTGFQPHFVALKGVRSAAERTTTDLLGRIVEGNATGLQGEISGPDGPLRPGIVLGVDLAESLLARVGDQVKIVALTPNLLTPFSMGVRSRTFRVSGIFEAGMYEFDSTMALISIGEAQEMFEMGDVASMIQVRVEDIYDTESVMAGIEEALGEGYYITDWKEMNRLFFSALKLEKLAMFVTISLIVMVAALNIVATLVLMVMEKQRDIGILLSMGATRRGIRTTFVLQGLIIGVVGTLLGCVLGIGLSEFFDAYRIIRLPEQVYYLSHLPFTVRPLDFSAVAFLAVAISYVATLYPAWRASRVDPVDAIRYE